MAERLSGMSLPGKLVAELPSELLEEIDHSCFATPTREMQNLGDRLGVHVVSYLPDEHRPEPGRKELCKHLAMAELEDGQIAELRDVELRTGVRLVAYQRPATLRPG